MLMIHIAAMATMVFGFCILGGLAFWAFRYKEWVFFGMALLLMLWGVAVVVDFWPLK